MPALVSQEQIDPCHVALTVQVAPEDLKKAIESVFNKFAKRTTVPGFRPGKAPRHLVKRFIDDNRVQEMALDESLNSAYRAAVKEAQVRVYAHADPQVDLPEEEVDPEKGYTFKATVALEPQVELGSLEGLTARRYLTPISDADVDKELARLAERAATFEPTTEPAVDGDRVRAAIHVMVDGELVEGMHYHHPTLIQVGSNFEEFDAGLRGVTAGEEKTFTFTYPADAEEEDLRGKTAEAAIEVVEVLRRTVPPVDEDFAVKAGLESLETLRERVRAGLQAQADAAADQDVNNTLVDELVRRATVHFPEEMVEREASGRVDNLIRALQTRNLTLNDFLAARKTDLATYQNSLREQARDSIRNTLVVLEFARQNGIRVSDKEVQEEIRLRAEIEGVKPAEMRRLLAETGDLDSIDDRIFFRKIAALLREKAQVTEVEA
jgi:trigger factor